MKKVYKFLIKYISVVCVEFVYGGHLLSIGGIGIILSITIILNLSFKIFILIIPYLSSQVVYSFNHFYEIDFDKDSNPERTLHLKKQRNWNGLLLICYVSLLFIILLTSNLTTFIFTFAIVIGGILYTLFIKELTSKFFPGFKNFYTSLFWALIVFLIPFYYDLHLSKFYLYIFLFVFLRWIVNSAFFDIKDIESDKKRKLKTFAVIFGKEGTLNLLHIINLISIFPILLGVYLHDIPNIATSYIIAIIYGFYYLSQALFLKGKNLRNFSYIIVDAEYIFWPIMILIGKSYL